MRLLRIRKSRKKRERRGVKGIGVEGNGGGGGETKVHLAFFLHSHYTTSMTVRKESKRHRAKDGDEEE